MGKVLVNLYGGPGTGKSTMMTGIFHVLKVTGRHAEFVPEFAKDLFYKGVDLTSYPQIDILDEQISREEGRIKENEICISDSPICLPYVYCYEYNNQKEPEKVLQRIQSVRKERVDKGIQTIDIFLKRTKPYNPIGRVQTEREAKELDEKIERIAKPIIEPTSHEILEMVNDHSALIKLFNRLS